MANKEHHGAKGEMWLNHSWTETSSGHIETYDDVKLECTPDEKARGSGLAIKYLITSYHHFFLHSSLK